jgi:hypothetical protein
MPAENPQFPLYDGSYQPTVAEQEKYHIQPYLPDPELVEAVQLAIHLGRPLLLRGDGRLSLPVGPKTASTSTMPSAACATPTWQPPNG